MPIDMSQFDKTARAAEQRVVAQARVTIVGAAQYLFRALQNDVKTAGIGSPIASGRYVASLRMSLNATDTSSEPADHNYHYPGGKGPRPLPTRTISNKQTAARISALLQGFKLGDSIIVSQSVPYSRKIEVGGHSWQAPGGVFAPTARATVTKFNGVNIKVAS